MTEHVFPLYPVSLQSQKNFPFVPEIQFPPILQGFEEQEFVYTNVLTGIANARLFERSFASGAGTMR